MGWNNVKYDFHDFLNKIRQELIIDSGTLSAHSIHAFADIPDVDITLQMGRAMRAISPIWKSSASALPSR